MRAAVILPYRAGCPHRAAARATVEQWWRTACPELDVHVVDDGGEPFSRGGSLNLGVERTDAEVIVAADADLLISRDQILEAVDLAAVTPGLVQPFTRLAWYAPKQTRLLLAAPHRAFGLTPPPPRYRWDVTASTPLLGGLNVLSRKTWEAAGGWLPRFRGWGHEDVAFAAQCRTLAGPLRQVEGTVHHLYHPKTGAYAAEETITANAAAAEAVAAADGDPEAMKELIAHAS